MKNTRNDLRQTITHLRQVAPIPGDEMILTMLANFFEGYLNCNDRRQTDFEAGSERMKMLDRLCDICWGHLERKLDRFGGEKWTYAQLGQPVDPITVSTFNMARDTIQAMMKGQFEIVESKDPAFEMRSFINELNDVVKTGNAVHRQKISENKNHNVMNESGVHRRHLIEVANALVAENVSGMGVLNQVSEFLKGETRPGDVEPLVEKYKRFSRELRHILEHSAEQSTPNGSNIYVFEGSQFGTQTHAAIYNAYNALNHLARGERIIENLNEAGGVADMARQAYFAGKGAAKRFMKPSVNDVVGLKSENNVKLGYVRNIDVDENGNETYWVTLEADFRARYGTLEKDFKAEELTVLDWLGKGTTKTGDVYQTTEVPSQAECTEQLKTGIYKVTFRKVGDKKTGKGVGEIAQMRLTMRPDLIPVYNRKTDRAAPKPNPDIVKGYALDKVREPNDNRAWRSVRHENITAWEKDDVSAPKVAESLNEGAMVGQMVAHVDYPDLILGKVVSSSRGEYKAGEYSDGSGTWPAEAQVELTPEGVTNAEVIDKAIRSRHGKEGTRYEQQTYERIAWISFKKITINKDKLVPFVNESVADRVARARQIVEGVDSKKKSFESMKLILEGLKSGKLNESTSTTATVWGSVYQNGSIIGTGCVPEEGIQFGDTDSGALGDYGTRPAMKWNYDNGGLLDKLNDFLEGTFKRKPWKLEMDGPDRIIATLQLEKPRFKVEFNKIGGANENANTDLNNAMDNIRATPRISEGITTNELPADEALDEAFKLIAENDANAPRRIKVDIHTVEGVHHILEDGQPSKSYELGIVRQGDKDKIAIYPKGSNKSYGVFSKLSDVKKRLDLMINKGS